jgi:hypothetical protein
MTNVRSKPLQTYPKREKVGHVLGRLAYLESVWWTNWYLIFHARGCRLFVYLGHLNTTGSFRTTEAHDNYEAFNQSPSYLRDCQTAFP